LETLHPMCATCRRCDVIPHETMMELVERVCGRWLYETEGSRLVNAGSTIAGRTFSS
jgi:hypothetical protein